MCPDIDYVDQPQYIVLCFLKMNREKTANNDNSHSGNELFFVVVVFLKTVVKKKEYIA